MSAQPLLAQILLSEPLLPDVEAVVARLREIWPDADPISRVSPEDDLFTFRLGRHTVAVSLDRNPVPAEQLAPPCAAAWYWPEAAFELAHHAAFLVVGLLPEEVDRLEAVKMLTRIASATATASDAAGVLWGLSGTVHAPAPFADYARQLVQGELPLYLWIQFQVRPEPDGLCSLCTTGLEPLGHLEIEIHHAEQSPQELLGLAYDVANFVLHKGPILKDGETIGTDDDQRIAISHGRSIRDDAMRVIRLGPASDA